MIKRLNLWLLFLFILIICDCFLFRKFVFFEDCTGERILVLLRFLRSEGGD